MFDFFGTGAAKAWDRMHPVEAAERDRRRREALMQEMSTRQLEMATGRNCLDIAVNGLPETALSGKQR